MKKKILSTFLALCMCLTLLPTAALAEEDPIDYEITVGSTAVTSANADNVLGVINPENDRPTVSYDAENDALTLNGATITLDAKEGNYGIFIDNYYTERLRTPKIKLEGENSVTLTGSMHAPAGIYSVGYLTITGDADSSLSVKGTDSDNAGSSSYGIYVSGSLSIEGGTTVRATGGDVHSTSYNPSESWGVYVRSGLTVDANSTLIATGGAISEPVNSSAESRGVEVANGTVTIYGKLKATGGSATVTGKKWVTSTGLYLKGSMTVEEGGQVTALGGSATSAGSTARSRGTYLEWGSAITVADGGKLESTGGTATGEALAYSYGIESFHDRITVSGGTLKAASGTATGDTAISTAIAAANGYDGTGIVVERGKLEATGGKALGVEEAKSCGINGGYGVNVTVNGGTLTAKGGPQVTAAKAYSYGVYTICGSAYDETTEDYYPTDGTVTVNGGKLEAIGGTIVVQSNENSLLPVEQPAIAQGISVGVYTNCSDITVEEGGTLEAFGGAVTAQEGYSFGLRASGFYYSNMDPFHRDERTDLTVVNVAVHGGTLNIAGGTVMGDAKAVSLGVLLERGVMYTDAHTSMVNVTGGSAAIRPESNLVSTVAVSIGVYAEAGDVQVEAGRMQVTAEDTGIWTTAEQDEEGDLTGGTVCIPEDQVEWCGSSPAFYYPQLSVTTRNGEAILAQSGILMGTSIAIVKPEGGSVKQEEARGLAVIADGSGAVAPEFESGLTMQAVSFVIEGASYSTVSRVPKGMSLNSAYAAMLESADVTDFAQILPTDREGYTFIGFYTGNGQKFDFDTPVTADLTLTARWTSDSASDDTAPTYSITLTDSDHGSVSLTVPRKYAWPGDTVSLTIAPDSGYALETLTVTTKNGKEADVTVKGNKATFKMPDSPVTVSATFMEDNSMLNFFTDVFPGDYYYDPVLWAAENDITGGVTETTFAPGQPCTRAQIVTFLYRWAVALGLDISAGEDTNILSYNDAFDIPEYAIPAFQWAVSAGILQGNDGALTPNDGCTRAQAVTFLFRFAAAYGMDFVTMQELVSGFGDAAQVPGYALSAMNWALAHGIVNGNNGDLNPNAPCTRAQIVTFLYRMSR